MNYLVYQQEKCPTTNKLHYQGYCELLKKKNIVGIKRLLGSDSVHIERRRGTAAGAIKYCKKEETRYMPPQEFGKPKVQGKRSDLDEIKTQIKAGATFDKIAWQCTNYQSLQMARALCALREPSHEFKPKKVYWIYGPTGKGKTRLAYHICKEGQTWHADSKRWFCGYYGQKYALIDELRAKNWPYDLMLKLLDGYQRKLDVKNSKTIWSPEVVVITCPLPPERIYAGQLAYQGSIDQLLRRITNLINIEDFNIDDHLEPEDADLPWLDLNSPPPEDLPMANGPRPVIRNGVVVGSSLINLPSFEEAMELDI